MGRIPIYTSRATMRTGPLVMPHPKMGTKVAEAIGGFARTVGKVGEDWATQKASVEAQAEYANNTLLYKQAVNNNITVQSEDASIDPDDLVPNYKKSMQEVSGSLVWKSKLAQKQFELNKGNFDLGAEQRLNVLGRNRFIANIKAGYETSRKAAVDNGDLKGGLLALQAIQSSFTPEQYKAEKIDLIHDVEYAQAGRALALDINADLKEFKNITPAEKAKLIKLAETERKRLKQIADDVLDEAREETEKSFTEKWFKNELTPAEVLSSDLTGKRQQVYLKLIGVDSAGAKAVNDIPTEAELLRRANTKEGTYQKFVDDVSKAVKEKTLTTTKAGTLLNKWFMKEKDVGYDLAKDVIYGDDVTLDFPTRDNLWINFNEMKDTEPDKYKGRASYDLAVKMREEEVEKQRSWFWDSWLFKSPISLLSREKAKPKPRTTKAMEKISKMKPPIEEGKDYSYLWKK